METRGRPFAAMVLVLAGITLVVAGGVYWALRHEYEVQLAKLSAQVQELEGQVQSLEQQLARTQVRPAPVGGRERRAAIQAEADEVLAALKDRDGATLAKYVHPQKGLRFTPYSHIDRDSDLVFTAAQVPALFADPAARTWGSYDGSGEPIILDFNGYYSRFVYDQNFLAAPQSIYNQSMQRGNMINNFTAAYPDAVSLEYYFPGFDPQYGGMDWRSLKLAFEPLGDTWYLVGIIHEQWTI